MVTAAAPISSTTPAATPRSGGTGLPDLDAWLDELLNRHAAVGFALGVVRNGGLEWFGSHGPANVETGQPITPDTVFRIASITKTMTAIAVMQLVEEGRISLDDPANEHLKAFRLIADQRHGTKHPATVRHLLTHTAGVPELVRATDLFKPDWGDSVPPDAPLPTLAEFYAEGIQLHGRPGSTFIYSNHGFAALQQIVEDVSGQPFAAYLKERIFEPLGMRDTSLERDPRLRARTATGYTPGRRGPRPVEDLRWVTAGASSVYSTTADMARYIGALLNGGGGILRPETMATMFAPHFRGDPRVPGMGLGFDRIDEGGHTVVGHGGIIPGFNSQMWVAPQDGIGLIAWTTGANMAMLWLPTETGRLMDRLLGVPEAAIRTDIPHRPETWPGLCGHYGFTGRLTDIRARLITGFGADVHASGDRLMLRLLTPIPGLLRGLELHPDSPTDPDIFRIDLTTYDLPAGRVVFSRRADGTATALHADFFPISLRRARPAPPIERLSSGDRLMLGASEIWPQDIGVLAILDGDGLWSAGGRLRIDAIRRRIRSRLHLVPRFRQVIRRPGRWLGGPIWVDAPRFELDEHVRVAIVDPPGGEAELLACIERLRRQPLDPTSRPGWELWFLTGLPGGQVGLFAKLHHAMADGMAAMTIIGALLDKTGETDAAAAPPWRPTPLPRESALAADAWRAYARGVAEAAGVLLRPVRSWRRVRAAMPAARELLAGEPPPPSSLDGEIGEDRRLAVMRTTLREMRSIAHAHDATVNDVLLAVIGGGLRALLAHRGELVAGSGAWTPIYVPVSLRRRWRGPVDGNRVAQMAVPLPLDTADPAARLRSIAAATAAGKGRDRSAVGKMFRTSLTTRLILVAADRQRVNVESANIPGPRRPLTFLGSRALEVIPVLPLIGRVRLGVGAVSYAGAFTIGITADRDAFPDLEVFVEGMRAELAALRSAS